MSKGKQCTLVILTIFLQSVRCTCIVVNKCYWILYSNSCVNLIPLSFYAHAQKRCNNTMAASIHYTANLKWKRVYTNLKIPNSNYYVLNSLNMLCTNGPGFKSQSRRHMCIWFPVHTLTSAGFLRVLRFSLLHLKLEFLNKSFSKHYTEASLEFNAFALLRFAWFQPNVINKNK